MKKRLLFVARLTIAAAAMYFATRKVDWQELKQFDWGPALFWLFPAFLCYNISQCISAYRLLNYYRILRPSIKYLFNLGLYYRGMLYNLFLPGGIGGDAYKIIALKTNENSYRQLTTATLLDRVTGLGTLVLIITALSMVIPRNGLFEAYFSVLPVLTVIGIPAYYFIIFYFFKPYHRLLPLAALLSVAVQGFQFLSFFCVLSALNIEADFTLAIAFLFFTSSVIAALPLSIGGIGTRELALATGAAYFHFSPTKLVSASLVFFLLVVVSSLVGWIISSSLAKRTNIV
jgi:uncharacterized membrane protein YbhN (UPF0104 family)